MCNKDEAPLWPRAHYLESKYEGAEWVVHSITHTHWDREWYLPFDTYRRKLVWVIENAMEVMESRPREFAQFWIDGQTSPILDYLEVRDDLQSLQRLARAINSGKLTVGPWYTSPDEFMPTGESIARNLFLGILWARKLGVEHSHVGYLADNFGHNSQIPQLLRLVGIDRAAMARGIPNHNPTEIVWEGADGSRVFTVYFKHWYCFGGDVPSASNPSAVESFYRSNLERAARDATTRHVIFMNGCDHTSHDPALLDSLGVLQGRIPGVAAIHSSIPHFMESVLGELGDRADFHRAEKPPLEPAWNASQLGTFVGLHQGSLGSPRKDQKEAAALRRPFRQVQVGPGNSSIPRGHYRAQPLPTERGELLKDIAGLSHVFSTKMTQKQGNWRCVSLIHSYAEPLQAMLYASGTLARYESHFINRAWKLAIQSHAHDSLGGCSVPEVHEDVDHRMLICQRTAMQLVTESLVALARSVQVPGADGRAHVVVVNTLPFARNRDLVLAVLEADLSGSVALCPVRGGEACVPGVVVRRGGEWDYILPDTGFRKPAPTHRSWIAFPATVPALGYAQFSVSTNAQQQGEAPLPVPEQRAAGGAVLQSRFLLVEVSPQGHITVLDKRRAGSRHSKLHQLILEGDNGNVYNFVHGGRRETPREVNVGPVESGGAGQHVMLQVRFQSLEMDVLYLVHDEMVMVRSAIRNSGSNFRLRALFPMCSSGPCSQPLAFVDVDGHFDVLRRSVNHPDGAAAAQAQQSFITMRDGSGFGFTVANRGIPSYAFVQQAAEDVGRDPPCGQCQALALDLFRATGVLGDWAELDVPTGQEQREVALQYAMIFSENAEGDRRLARQFQTPLASVQPKDFAGIVLSGPLFNFEAGLLDVIALARGSSIAQPPRPRPGSGSGRDIPRSRPTAPLPPAKSWLQLDPPDRMVMTAVKMHERRGDSVVVRFFLAHGLQAGEEAVLRVSVTVAQAFKCNLLEERLQELRLENTAASDSPLGTHAVVRVPLVRSKEIVTVELVLAERAGGLL